MRVKAKKISVNLLGFLSLAFLFLTLLISYLGKKSEREFYFSFDFFKVKKAILFNST